MNEEILDEKFKKALSFYNTGNLKQADQIYREILVSEPSNDRALYGLGLISFQDGNLTEANQLLKKAISINPDSLEYQAALGNTLYTIGNYPKSIDHYKKALEKDPQNPYILNNLGHAYQANLDIKNAILSYKDATSNDKNNLEYKANLAGCLQKANNFELAKKEYKTILKKCPNNLQILNILGTLYLENNQIDYAKKYFKKCIALDPEYVLAYNGLGFVEIKNKNIEEAVKCYKKALEIDPIYFEAILNLAKSYELSNQQEEKNSTYEISKIIDLYEKALSVNKNHEKTLNSIGCAYEISGDIEKSKMYFKKLLSVNPSNFHAIYNYTRLMNKKNYTDEYIKNIEEIANNNKNKDEIYLLNFSLANIYDKKGEYILAENNYVNANLLKNKKNKYSKNRTKIIFDETIKYFNNKLYNKLRDISHKSVTPIFIIGMPRSGTSLVEQIVSNHERVHGAGEIYKMVQIEEKYKKMFSKKVKYPKSIKFINEETIQNLSNQYSDYLTFLNPKLNIFTDKLPENFIRIGLIKLLFPNAKIIHCKRHPIDTCLSIFFTLFSDNIDYSYNLRNIADYYLRYTHIMEHWKKIFSDEIYDINYEDLVSNPENNIRNIFNYCNLDWNDRLLNHLENIRPVHTASVMQVKEPIYKTSIGRFKNYPNLVEELVSIQKFESLISCK